MTDESLAHTLRSRGQRVTSQRLVLLETLRELGRHTTADDLLRAVQPRLPSMALPTVYSTLELFEELRLVRRVDVANGPALFDPLLDGHHHAACRRCGRVEDLPPSLDVGPAIAAAAAAGYEAPGAEVVVSGLCADCAAAQTVRRR